nr:ABC transporter ATP-binding protein [Saprospiraceae bacterium]
MEQKLLLEVEKVGKKFCKDLKWSMFHGMTDMLKITFCRDLKRDQLRAEEFWALTDINLKLFKGDILCILGNNGSGKTTLMRLISGIYPIDKGKISIHGKISSLFAIRSGMHPHFSGRENIYIKGGMFGLNQKQIKEKMEWIIEFSELRDFIDSPLGTYSAGMRSRLGYSIAVGTQPDILIIDEGLAVGDASFRLKCFQNLKAISKECGIIFITHNIKRVKVLANRIMILDKGQFVYESTDVKEGMNFYIDNCAKLSTREFLS